MKGTELKSLAERVRAIPLEAVLRALAARPDCHDPAKWHTDRGPLSVTGAKFMNWRYGVGGGGAIDLALHLLGCDFRTALLWLARRFPDAGHAPNTPVPGGPRTGLRLPPADEAQLDRVRHYMHLQRGLPLDVLQPPIEAGTIYADARGNAVFLLRTEEGEPLGAELRGTGTARWRGIAPGSRKDRAFFSVGDPDASTLILCESAIDALSCLVLRPEAFCVSTSGVTNRPRWLTRLMRPGRLIYCGFDADEPGERMATALIARFPSMLRLRPQAHDWNDQLRLRIPVLSPHPSSTLF